MGSDATQPFIRARIKTGNYTGNGADDRNIDIGIDLSSKTTVFVMVKDSNHTRNGTFRIEYGQGDLSSFFAGAQAIADCIQSFNSTGFQVGANPITNEAAAIYEYTVLWSEP